MHRYKIISFRKVKDENKEILFQGFELERDFFIKVLKCRVYLCLEFISRAGSSFESDLIREEIKN